MEIEIINAIKSFEGPKRVYVPGLKIQCKCPDCNLLMVKDYSLVCFNEPLIGPESKYIDYLYCDDCEKEIELILNIDLTITLLQAKEL